LLPANILTTEGPGQYLLAVSAADNDPRGVLGEIFPGATTDVTRPSGLSRFDPLVDWTRDVYAAAGNYSLSLTAARGLLAPAVADFDEDGDVDADDLARWREGFGVSGSATHGQGDADSDRDVDGADFLAWQCQVGSGATKLAASGDVPTGGGVPEPTGLTLAAIAVVVAASRQVLKGERHIAN
jgi:hypothetical protein